MKKTTTSSARSRKNNKQQSRKTKPLLAELVMKKIENQELKMLPKIYFWLGSALLGIGSVGVFGLTTIFASLWMFHMRMQRLFSAEAFDQLHRPMLLDRFPWSYFIIAILSFAIGLALIKKYDFVYKKNWWVIVIGMLFGVVLVAGLIDGLGLSDRLSRNKGLGRFYKYHVDELRDEGDRFGKEFQPSYPQVRGRMHLKEISR